MPMLIRLIKSLILANIVAFSAAAWAERLSAYNVAPDTVTISGISSGGMMAVQAHVAYSTTFRGAAILAGTPYYCAEGTLANLGRCTQILDPVEIPVNRLAWMTRQWAQQGLIDPVSGLQQSPIYLFSGSNDLTVQPAAMDALEQYYRHFAPAEHIRYSKTVPAGHSWVSPLGPIACESQQTPYINDCGVDPQQEFLTQFYGKLAPRQSGALKGQFLPVDQTEFFAGPVSRYSMDTTGWLYVPASCAAGKRCRLHVSLHGCSMSYTSIAQAFITLANLNEWADTNDILVLYPQARPSQLAPVNPQGCWDWWGYTGADYAHKSGPQLKALKAMVDRITSGRVGGGR